MSARTNRSNHVGASSICFGDADHDIQKSRPSSRVNRPGGTGGVSSLFEEDATSVSPASASPSPPASRGSRKANNSQGMSSIFGGDPLPEDNRKESKKMTSRTNQPGGGTGGSSSLFGESPDEATKDEVVTNKNNTSPDSSVTPSWLSQDPSNSSPSPAKISTRIAQPGGTGGASSLFTDAPPSPPAPSSGSFSSPAKGPATDPLGLSDSSEKVTPSGPEHVHTSARILQPGGTGGKSSIFGDSLETDATEEQLRKGMRRMYVSKGAESTRSNGQQQCTSNSDESSSDEDTSDEESSGRSTRSTSSQRGRENDSQVAIAGDYPLEEPKPRSSRRGRIRTSANHSQIVMSDDLGGEENPNERNAVGKPSTFTKPSSRVLRPGGTGGSSQIVIGDDINEVQQSKGSSQPGGVHTSSRVLRPGGTGGTSQVQIAWDN
ncbi:MAG: hypothetical protein DHS80DRAFT_33250 [Piptocephalis tieghemiana]|nr:MAG: hypothetical protein DHS80DRAFT_33250 [Piptocephalis tieghemiana]